jgi:poly(hydroxyalkanoate) granule-associated protein
MSEQDASIVENGQEKGSNLFTRAGDVAVKTFYVGLGSVGFAQDELKKLWDGGGSLIKRLEERGESMSQSGRERLDEERNQLNSRFETRQEKVKDLGAKANDSLEKASGAVLTRANIPTADEIQGLSKQINALNRKVDKLRREQKALAEEQAAETADGDKSTVEA